jgi:heme-degrading monooxygenase HmoA
MYTIIWEYRVKPEAQREFERIYAPDGTWAKLFTGEAGFLGTELLHSEQTPGLYVTIDRWESRESYERFRTKFTADYEALDARCEVLSEHERQIGSFSRVTS